MNDQQQTFAFVSDLQKVIERYRAEFNLTLATAIGALEIVKLELFLQQTKDHEADTD